ncbi:uncharacterized protein LOC131319460 isoform X1 [Rhododendron vialii]|uniref:uncharacterized protein LOC131319460 isoform X1 n=1 Tax=Rhododendron vialii TaxID=182163 RepID=UPI00265DB12E|nr:uncharacterized protein LOC131319460 isoform X1 [Rhododendron vialii]
MQMELQKGVQRWVVDISQWNPSSQEFSHAMSFLPQHEHPSITGYVKLEDQKRAIVSRLLQYSLVHEVLGIPFNEIIIKRTLEGKPYLEHNKVDHEFPNFNFNASHHGDYVAIASEPLCIVGLDIVSHSIPGKETIPEFIQIFCSYFSRLEWDSIMNAGSCDDMLNEFYRYWCVKEAFVKAIGTGVGYGLDSVEFHHTRWTNIFVKLDGKELKEWRFWLYELGKRHMVSIAKGHPNNATETYKRTLKRTEFDEEHYHLGLHLPNVSFVQRTVEQLIPVSSKSHGVNLGQ